jgi:hypothetical protein
MLNKLGDFFSCVLIKMFFVGDQISNKNNKKNSNCQSYIGPNSNTPQNIDTTCVLSGKFLIEITAGLCSILLGF